MTVLQGARGISWHLCVRAQHLHLLKVTGSLKSPEPAAGFPGSMGLTAGGHVWSLAWLGSCAHVPLVLGIEL